MTGGIFDVEGVERYLVNCLDDRQCQHCVKCPQRSDERTNASLRDAILDARGAVVSVRAGDNNDMAGSEIDREGER